MSLPIYYMGPSGGTGGYIIDPGNRYYQPRQLDNTFSTSGVLADILKQPDSGIREIVINSGNYIDSITVSYVGANDDPYGTYKMGGDGGSAQVIQLTEGEFISGIEGWYGKFVTNFSFITNLNKISSFGGNTSPASPFYYFAPAGYEVIGLWGAAGEYVDRLGVIIRLLNQAKSSVSAPIL